MEGISQLNLGTAKPLSPASGIAVLVADCTIDWRSGSKYRSFGCPLDFRGERAMFWVFLALAYVTIVIAWVHGKALSALGRWSEEHPNSQLARDIEIEMDPAKHRDEFDFGSLGLTFAMVLLVLLFVPSAVTGNGQSISTNEISDSMQASTDIGTVNAFVHAWRAEYPLKFWAFFAGLPLTVIWLFRRSPVWLGVAVVVALFVFWLKVQAGISTLSF